MDGVSFYLPYDKRHGVIWSFMNDMSKRSAVGISSRVGDSCELCLRRGAGGANGRCSLHSGEESPSPTVNGFLKLRPPACQQVKVALIGSSGVGKTALVKQFVQNEFPETHLPTKRRICYSPSVVVEDRLYQLILSDLPPIRSYPQNTFAEWAEYRRFGLRSAAAVVFVFDLTRADSFTHIKMLRDQLAESRDIRELGVLVVGNKRDLLPDDGRERRDYASAVRKHWKVPYMEVSAKYNWHVVAAFREILLSFEEARGTHKDVRPHNLQELHEAIEHSKCNIL